MRDVGGREPLRPEIDGLYDAFQHSRAEPGRAAAARPGRGARVRGARCATRRSTCSERSPLRGRRLVEHGFAFGMIVQHEQQHDETMLATHQLRAGAPVLHAPPPPAAAAPPRGRPRCWSRRGRSRWAPTPSRGRWTTSGPRTVVDLPAFRIDTAPVTNGAVRGVRRRRRLRRPALVERARAGRTGGEAGLVAPLFWERDGDGVVAAPVRRRSSRCRPTSRCCTSASTRPRPTRAGRASGCPPRRSGRRPPGSTRRPGRSRRYPWGDDEPDARAREPRPAPPAARPGRAPTRRARRRWACTS